MRRPGAGGASATGLSARNRDYKSHGFDLEQSKITEPARLNVLLLAMAITTLWMIHVGDWLIRERAQPGIDAGR